MPKMTAKYAGALAIASKAFRHTDPLPNDNDQEGLYTALQQRGYFWDSQIKQWEYHEPEAADDPTPLVMIRIWSDIEITSEMADDLQAALAEFPRTKGWQLIERSTPYQCRPPKQLEARIYLKFLPK